jgi:hypothetical protein
MFPFALLKKFRVQTFVLHTRTRTQHCIILALASPSPSHPRRHGLARYAAAGVAAAGRTARVRDARARPQLNLAQHAHPAHHNPQKQLRRHQAR